MKSGATLIELLIVVIIVAILSTMGAVFYNRFLTQNLVDNYGDTIVQNLRRAQIYALESRKSETLGWGVNYAANKITLYLGNTYAGRTVTWDQSTTRTGYATISAFEVNFARVTGLPDAAETITIFGRNKNDQIYVNSMGMIGRI